MSQNRRQQAIDGFRNGKHDILVATDVASRGIDVSEISHVINFDMPNSVDDYIHRIGRTGRAENVGEAITFTLPENEYLLKDIEKALGNSIERKRLNEFNYEGFDPSNKSSNFRKPVQGKHKPTPYHKQNRRSKSTNTWHGKKRPYKTATR
jgi:ATP-dependent RNA helicase RhlE